MDARLSAKFPFLKEALEFAEENSADLESLLTSENFSPARARGRERVLDAIAAGEVVYKPLMRDYDCLMEVMSYPYARMLVSVIWDRYLTKRYALGEAVRMNKVLSGEDHRTMIKVSDEMGFHAETDPDGTMRMGFPDYLMLSSRMKSIDWKLINSDVRAGMVVLPGDKFNRLMQNALQDTIESELPLKPPEEFLQYLEKDAAAVKMALDEAKAKMSPTRDEGMKDAYLPPCVKHLLELSMKGINLPHSGRFALVTFLSALGLDYDAIIRIFAESPDFDESKSEYQIKHITGELNGTDPYTPPECKTMKTNGLCHEPDALCEHVNHPLNYYRIKSGTRRPKDGGEGRSRRRPSLLRFLQVIIALWTAVRFPTTANQIIMTSIQLMSNPAISKDPYPSADATYWIIGNNVDRTTLSARPSRPAYRRGAPMAWAWVPMYEVSRTPTRATIPR